MMGFYLFSFFDFLCLEKYIYINLGNILFKITIIIIQFD